MMEYPLTLAFILRRAETLFGHKAIITRRPDKTIHRYTYADFVPRAKKLAVALQQLGLRRGDRVATLCWNQYEHLEAYFGIPLAGNVLHPINPRLHPTDLAYIVNDAEDRVLIIDDTLLPLLEKFRADVRIEHIVVVEHGAQATAGLRPVAAARPRGRRLGRAEIDDPRLRRAARASRPPRLGYDRDDAARCRVEPDERSRGHGRGDAPRLSRKAGIPGAARRDPRPERRGPRGALGREVDG